MEIVSFKLELKSNSKLNVCFLMEPWLFAVKANLKITFALTITLCEPVLNARHNNCRQVINEFQVCLCVSSCFLQQNGYLLRFASSLCPLCSSSTRSNLQGLLQPMNYLRRAIDGERVVRSKRKRDLLGEAGVWNFGKYLRNLIKQMRLPEILLGGWRVIFEYLCIIVNHYCANCKTLYFLHIAIIWKDFKKQFTHDIHLEYKI